MRWGRWMAGVLVASVAFAAPARAQEPEPKKDAAPDQKPAASKPAAPDALSGIDIGDVSKISNEEKQSRAEKSLAEERDALKRVTQILSEARQSKDIVQLNCVNEKLTQIKGLLRISEDASSRMYDAIGAGTQDVVDHEFTKIAIAHQKTQSLRAEAEQCVGEFSVYSGETEVTVVTPPTTENPTQPQPTPPGPEVPPVASRF